jgi:hypothetical protein
MGNKDESVVDDSIETHLQQDILPKVLIHSQNVEFIEGDVDENRKNLWKAIGPSLDELAEKFQLPKQKPNEMTDVGYFKFLVEKMFRQSSSVRRKDKELPKWSVWPAIAMETGAANCSLGSQIVLRLLENAGYDVEYGTPGPLTHAVAVAKSGSDTYYIDPTNRIVEKVAETTEVDGVKVYILKTDAFSCPFEAIPAFPPEFSVVATIANLQALQSENDKLVHSDFVEKVAEWFSMNKNRNYLGWVKENLFPEWDKLTTTKYWKEEKARVETKLRH